MCSKLFKQTDLNKLFIIKYSITNLLRLLENVTIPSTRSFPKPAPESMFHALSSWTSSQPWSTRSERACTPGSSTPSSSLRARKTQRTIMQGVTTQLAKSSSTSYSIAFESWRINAPGYRCVLLTIDFHLHNTKINTPRGFLIFHI